MNESNRLLVVDDDADIREIIRTVGEKAGYDVREAAAANEVGAAVTSFSPTVIILDLVMPGTDGVETLRQLAEQSCKATIMVASGVGAKVVQSARELGIEYGLNVVAALAKPLSLAELEARLVAARSQPERISAAELQEAILAKQLTVFFQPKVALLADGSTPIVGAEALVRWQHPIRGLLAPDKFLPAIEEAGLMGPLTDFVVDETIACMLDWRQLGIDLSTAVNFPPQLLTRLDLPDRIAGSLHSAGIEPSRLVLEITESAAMEKDARPKDILTRFRLKGLGLSLDDFGVGYSSLVELYKMPFTELKIDQSFVRDIDENKDARTIVAALVGLAHSLELTACAEGAETVAALEKLRQMGCDKCQGYVISKPLPPDAFVEFILAQTQSRPERASADIRVVAG